MVKTYVTVLGAVLALLVMPGMGLCQGDASRDYPSVLKNVHEELLRSFAQLDGDLSNAAGRIAKSGLTGNDARAALRGLCADKVYAIDCAAVNSAGVMVTIEPPAFRKFEGVSISKQDQVIALQKTKQAVLSRVFRSEEGIDAVDMEHPVFSADQAFMGSVSILFKPEEFLSFVIGPLVRGFSSAEIWVVQKDGRILYDIHRNEIGRMLFSDPLYKPFPELIRLGEKIVRQAEGHGFYDFTDAKTKLIIRKEAFWTTVGMHGTEWRIVASRPVAGK